MFVRRKLFITFIVVVFSLYAFLALMTVIYFDEIYLREVQTRVQLDLNSAQNEYDNNISELGQIINLLSFERNINVGMPLLAERDDILYLKKYLDLYQKKFSLDILTLTDVDGNVLYRAHNPERYGDNLRELSIIQKTINSKNAVSGSLIIPGDYLKNDGIKAQDKARVKIIPTKGAKINDSSEMIETSALAIAAVSPIGMAYINDKVTKIKGIKGYLFGARILNNANSFVDKIKKQIFIDEVFQGKNVGTTTIFLNDIRIATNVIKDDGFRATGSRLSEKVFNNVLVKGEKWVGEAFVYNDYYISAYEGIRDVNDKIIGALYVGLLKKPFVAHKNSLLIIFFSILLFVTLITSVVSYFLTRSIIRPLENIINIIEKVVSGDMSARLTGPFKKEFETLSHTINNMLDAFAKREDDLKESTQVQLSRSEKLASIGRLAAGVAHEVNNPLTGVMTFAHLLKDKNHMTEEDKADLDIIIRETLRVREITRGLLDFSRQSPSNREMLDLNTIVEQVKLLVHGQKDFKRIKFTCHLDGNLNKIVGDKNQIQQVLLNLILNALESMVEKGQEGLLTVVTNNRDDDIELKISDTGVGIKKDNLDKIFEPFYTTKPVGTGTGLGLSVVYGNIKKHSGRITVDSEENIGTTFTICFPRVKESDLNEKITIQ